MTAVHTEVPGSPPELDLSVRSQLPAGVLARPLDEAVPLHAWVLVAELLDASAHALACAAEQSPAAILELLVVFAEGTAARTEAELLVLQPSVAPTLPTTDHRLDAEQTWLRLAAVLLGAPPTDPALLLTCVRDHRKALTQWRAAL